MPLGRQSRKCWPLAVALALLVGWSAGARAESCQAASDMDDATRAAITSAGQRYFDLVAKGDTATLRQNAIASLASDFGRIEATVRDFETTLAGSQAAARPPFLLDAEGVEPLARAEFFCGLFTGKGQSSTSAIFVLNNLPAGKYAVVMLDATSPKASVVVSFVLQLVGNDWKMGGLYIKPRELAGHDSDWFLNHAREYKAKGQMHNAWLYYRAALNLISPLPFMSTRATDNLYDELQPLQPVDAPTDEKTAELAAGNTIYKLTALFLDAFGSDLNLVVRYQSSDVSNTAQTYQNNVAVAKTLVAKYPELRNAFDGVVARAIDSNGHDYGTLLAMKDIR
jgi:hypothetical protein